LLQTIAPKDRPPAEPSVEPTTMPPMRFRHARSRSRFSRIASLIVPVIVPVIALCAAAGPASAQSGAAVDGALPAPLPLLPASNWWNVDISHAPIDTNSSTYITFVGNTRRLHPDWGGSAHDPDDPNAIYGIPYISVPGSQPLVPVTFVDYDDESDAGAPGRPAGYPIPDEAKNSPGWMEAGGPASHLDTDLDSESGDRHMLIVDRDNRILYELYRAHWNATRNRWEAGSGAVWPLTTNRRRPEGWTSADAAGLAIMPGLVRYDETFGTEPIKHAFRFTVRDSNGFVFPASHNAGSQGGALPMGARLRLKASVNISTFAAPVQRILQAMKTYGLIVADNGTDMYIQGTSDPRWDPQMDDFVSGFNKLNAGMFEVVQLGWQPPQDTDNDGLTDDWETQFGLNPNSATGDDGAAGDPDHDGVTNLQEFQNHTHPKGVAVLTRYLAEGSNNDFFRTTIDLANPSTTSDAAVLLRFLKSDGTIVPYAITVPKQRHVTVATTAVDGLQSADFSTVIETDVEVVAERTMVWTPTLQYGSHSETAVKAPALQWYLAEGATHGVFSLFYLLANPGDTQADVEIRYLLPGGQAPIVLTYPVPAHSRRTIPVDDEPGLKATDVSAAITSTNGVPIIAERAMYFSRPGQDFAGGHDSAGVTQPSSHWFFAEGATGSFFDMFLLLANPDATRTAHVTISYLLTDGTIVPVQHDLPPNSRQTYNVSQEDPKLASAAMSTVVDSPTVPIVAERSMYWPKDWIEAHNSPGATETGTMWAVAGGEEGGAFGAQTYVLIANTSTFAGTARVTVLQENGAPLTIDVPLPASSRTNVAIGSTDVFAPVIGSRFGVVVQSLGGTPAQIVVERATYANDDAGVVWAAGASALGTKLQ
jgi:hypothetical protein